MVEVRVKCLADGVLIVTRFLFQKSFADERINFRFAQFDIQATKPITAPLPVPTHPLGSSRDAR
jgi:hypothetical protein